MWQIIRYGLFALLITNSLQAKEQSGEESFVVKQLNSGVKASLRGLSVVSDEVVWASGAKGTVLRSIDAGATWKKCPAPDQDELDFRDVHGFSSKVALILSAGSPARIYRTEDGGKTFSLRYENKAEAIFFDGMAFWDNQNGIAFSDPLDGYFVILLTKDGGRTWKAVEKRAGPKALYGEFGFAASGTGIAVTGKENVVIGLGGTTGLRGARVLRSANRGMSWQVAVTPINTGESSGIFSIALAGKTGVAVGGDYKKTEANERVASYSRDGGISWQTCKQMPGGFRSAVAAWRSGSQLRFLCIGPGGCDASSDGQTWTKVGDTGAHTIGCADRFAFATGADGTILRFERQR